MGSRVVDRRGDGVAWASLPENAIAAVVSSASDKNRCRLVCREWASVVDDVVVTKLTAARGTLPPASVLARRPNLCSVAVYRATTGLGGLLDDWGRLARLRSLYLSASSGAVAAALDSLEPLTACPLLEELGFEFFRVCCSLAPLARLPRLRSLSLKHAHGSSPPLDLSPLTACSALARLRAAPGVPVQSYAPLAACPPSLVELDLRFTTCTLLRLAECFHPRLRVLDISCSSTIDDLTPLAACGALETLDAACTPVRSVAPLASCTRLRRLDISRTAVADVSPLASCTALESLNIYRTRVSLNIYRTRVTDAAVAALSATCPKLTVTVTKC